MMLISTLPERGDFPTPQKNGFLLCKNGFKVVVRAEILPRDFLGNYYL